MMAQTSAPIRPEAVTIGDEAIPDLLNYLSSRGLDKLVLVADTNTYPALGADVEASLREQGVDLTPIIFTNEEVIADAHHVLEVMVNTDAAPRTYLAVGSGTITDITRFVSWRTGNSFISVPTAPSVDGFTSLGAPLIINGVKTTILTHSPRAIFADLSALTAAPKDMIAAGFADMLGKYTSAADWRIGRLLWDEPYDEEIALRTIAAGTRTTDEQAALIGEGSPEGVRALMEGLIESGYCMLDFGSSRNASGAEHHYSHYWEMHLLQEGRPAILHGAKVGVATVLVAQLYDMVKQLFASRSRICWRSRNCRQGKMRSPRSRMNLARWRPRLLPTRRPSWIAARRSMMKSSARFSTTGTKSKRSRRTCRPQTILPRSLQQVGGPITVGQLGLTPEEQADAEQYGHYLRQRFTVRKLMGVLGLDEAL